MEESSPPSHARSPSPGEALRAGFASFDAASFLENQQKQRERKAADLLAAADALCPSSSEDTSSSDSEASSHGEQLEKILQQQQAEEEKEDGELVIVGKKRKPAGNKPASDEKHLKKRKKDHPKKTSISKHDRRIRKKSKKERRHREKKAEKTEFAGHDVAAGEGSGKSSLGIPFSTTIDYHQKSNQQAQQEYSYFSEKRPDPGNIAFGKLYRFEVPRYRRYDPSGYVLSLLNLGRDEDSVDEKGTSQSLKALNKKLEKEKLRKKGATMWWRPRRPAVANSSKEENRVDLFRRLDSEYVTLDPSKDFIEEEDAKKQQHLVVNLAGKEENELQDARGADYFSPEDYILQKTRDFNVTLRQNPQNLQLWLDFSAFQDEITEISGGNRRRGAVRATAEKQIAILERGLEHHPGSDTLLLALLEVASKICDSEEMENRWQRVLLSCPSSLKLWKAYLLKKRHQFAIFKTGDVNAAYYQALSALKRENTRLLHLLDTLKINPGGENQVNTTKLKLAELDTPLVEILLLAISFNLQTGYTELGIAAVRAVLEYNWFAPKGWPEDALEMMFEEFYKYFIEVEEGSLKMIGDAGATGWGAWISGEEEIKEGEASVEGEKEEPGGWVEVPREEIAAAGKVKTGSERKEKISSAWEELAPTIQARFGDSLNVEETKNTSGLEEKEIEKDLSLQEEEDEEIEEETDEQLLFRLGMDLDAVLADEEEELTLDVLFTWLDIEYQRDSQQWEAFRGKNIDEETAEKKDKDLEENEENVFKRVCWEDLAPYIVSIHEDEARAKLLRGCLQLLGVPSLNSSSNSVLAESEDDVSVAASWLGIGGNSLEPADPSAVSVIEESEWGWLSDRAVLGNHAVRDMPWWAASRERHSFVLNLLTTLFMKSNSSLKSRYDLAFTTLNLASWTVPSPSITSTQQQQEGSGCKPAPARDWAAGRALAKDLLSQQRDNLVLYAAFASIEKLSGRIKAARKVYTACLSGLQKLPGEGHALPAGLVELVLGLSHLELEDSAAAVAASSKKEKNTSNSVTNLVQGSCYLISVLRLLRATPQALQAAARPLLFLGSRGKICLETSAVDTSKKNITTQQEEIILARRGYQDGVLRMLRAGPNGFDSQEAVAQVLAAAAAELVFAACESEGSNISSSIGRGVTAALALYKQVIDAISSYSGSGPSFQFSNIFLETVEIQQCSLAVDAAVHAVHTVPPTLAREIVSNALHRYPSSPGLLRMLRSLEVNVHALTALRRQLNSILSSSPYVSAWMMLVGVEIGANAARTAIRAALLRALSHPSGMHSPLLWRCSLRFERAFGTPESLHRTFLRAVETCPWSKALWCDGLQLLNGYCSPKELSEYLTIMKDKELAVRTDVLEAVLARLE